MARVGWRVKVQFDDGTWYGGQIGQIEEEYVDKQGRKAAAVADGGSWWLRIEYDDGDVQITEFPNNNVKIDMDLIHGIDITRLHGLRSIPVCLKAWFIYYLIKNRRLPEWHDAKVYLTSHAKFPIDAEFRGCRCPRVRNRIRPQQMDEARLQLEKARKVWELCTFKCTAKATFGDENSNTDMKSFQSDKYKQKMKDKRDKAREGKGIDSKEVRGTLRSALDNVMVHANGSDTDSSDEE
jgi:hypothetical protein